MLTMCLGREAERRIAAWVGAVGWTVAGGWRRVPGTGYHGVLHHVISGSAFSMNPHYLFVHPFPVHLSVCPVSVR